MLPVMTAGAECEWGMTASGPVDVRAINPEELDAFGFVASTALALYGPVSGAPSIDEMTGRLAA